MKNTYLNMVEIRFQVRASLDRKLDISAEAMGPFILQSGVNASSTVVQFTYSKIIFDTYLSRDSVSYISDTDLLSSPM
jgi:hypothetical protein